MTSKLGRFPTKRVKKLQTFLYQGEVPRSSFVIKEGVIRIYNINSKGEENVIAFLTEKSILPTEWIFEKSPVSMYYYEALSDCVVYVIPKEKLLEIIKSNEGSELYGIVTAQLVSSMVHINALEQSKASDKLLYTLQHLVLSFGEQRGANLSRIKLRLTHQDIAHIMGLTRETTALELGKLKKKGVISYEKQRYLVRTDKLLHLLGEEDFKNVRL